MAAARVVFAVRRSVSSVARPQGSHALLAGQRVHDLGTNISHFHKSGPHKLRYDREPQLLNDDLAPLLLALASRTVRVACTFNDEACRTVPQLTLAGSGLLLGRHVLTAAHNLPLRYKDATLARIGISGDTISRLPHAQRVFDWYPAQLDYEITSAIQEHAAAVETVNVDGTLWEDNCDVAVLKLHNEHAKILQHDFISMPPLSASTRTVAGISVAVVGAAALQTAAEHFVIGYPCLPEKQAPDAIAKLWHGNEPITSEQLFAIMGDFETRILSRGTSISTPALAAAEARMPISAGCRRASLLPYCANSMGGMSGGPVINNTGQLVGIHVGGRESAGDYNAYLPIDHPALATALDIIDRREQQQE